MKKIFKKIKLFRRLYNGYQASSYFNYKYFQILKWMFVSNEDTNYTYTLTEKNLDELSKLLEIIFPESSFKQNRKIIDEIVFDNELKKIIRDKLKTSNFSDFTDEKVQFSRRIGWYTIARILKPKIIVETGVDKGMGALVLCRALQKNKEEGFDGFYYGTEINVEAGYLFKGELAKFGEIIYGDSIKTLLDFTKKIDLFVNDSDHSADYEYREYLTIRTKLSKNAIILGDNSHETDKLLRFSVDNNRNFTFFKETPKDHWYPGAGIGISYPKNK